MKPRERTLRPPVTVNNITHRSHFSPQHQETRHEVPADDVRDQLTALVAAQRAARRLGGQTTAAGATLSEAAAAGHRDRRLTPLASIVGCSEGHAGSFGSRPSRHDRLFNGSFAEEHTTAASSVAELALPDGVDATIDAIVIYAGEIPVASPALRQPPPSAIPSLPATVVPPPITAEELDKLGGRFAFLAGMKGLLADCLADTPTYLQPPPSVPPPAAVAAPLPPGAATPKPAAPKTGAGAAHTPAGASTAPPGGAPPPQTDSEPPKVDPQALYFRRHLHSLSTTPSTAGTMRQILFLPEDDATTDTAATAGGAVGAAAPVPSAAARPRGPAVLNLLEPERLRRCNALTPLATAAASPSPAAAGATGPPNPNPPLAPPATASDALPPRDVPAVHHGQPLRSLLPMTSGYIKLFPLGAAWANGGQRQPVEAVAVPSPSVSTLNTSVTASVASSSMSTVGSAVGMQPGKQRHHKEHKSPRSHRHHHHPAAPSPFATLLQALGKASAAEGLGLPPTLVKVAAAHMTTSLTRLQSMNRFMQERRKEALRNALGLTVDALPPAPKTVHLQLSLTRAGVEHFFATRADQAMLDANGGAEAPQPPPPPSLRRASSVADLAGLSAWTLFEVERGCKQVCAFLMEEAILAPLKVNLCDGGPGGGRDQRRRTKIALDDEVARALMSRYQQFVTLTAEPSHTGEKHCFLHIAVPSYVPAFLRDSAVSHVMYYVNNVQPVYFRRAAVVRHCERVHDVEMLKESPRVYPRSVQVDEAGFNVGDDTVTGAKELEEEDVPVTDWYRFTHDLLHQRRIQRRKRKKAAAAFNVVVSAPVDDASPERPTPAEEGEGGLIRQEEQRVRQATIVVPSEDQGGQDDDAQAYADDDDDQPAAADGDPDRPLTVGYLLPPQAPQPIGVFLKVAKVMMKMYHFAKKEPFGGKVTAARKLRMASMGLSPTDLETDAAGTAELLAEHWQKQDDQNSSVDISTSESSASDDDGPDGKGGGGSGEQAKGPTDDDDDDIFSNLQAMENSSIDPLLAVDEKAVVLSRIEELFIIHNVAVRPQPGFLARLLTQKIKRCACCLFARPTVFCHECGYLECGECFAYIHRTTSAGSDAKDALVDYKMLLAAAPHSDPAIAANTAVVNTVNHTPVSLLELTKRSLDSRGDAALTQLVAELRLKREEDERKAQESRRRSISQAIVQQDQLASSRLKGSRRRSSVNLLASAAAEGGGERASGADKPPPQQDLKSMILATMVVDPDMFARAVDFLASQCQALKITFDRSATTTLEDLVNCTMQVDMELTEEIRLLLADHTAKAMRRESLNFDGINSRKWKKTKLLLKFLKPDGAGDSAAGEDGEDDASDENGEKAKAKKKKKKSITPADGTADGQQPDATAAEELPVKKRQRRKAMVPAVAEQAVAMDDTLDDAKNDWLQDKLADMATVTDGIQGIAIVVAVSKFHDLNLAPLPAALTEAERLREVLEQLRYAVDIMHEACEEEFLQPTIANIARHIDFTQRYIINNATEEVARNFLVIVLSRGAVLFTAQRREFNSKIDGGDGSKGLQCVCYAQDSPMPQRNAGVWIPMNFITYATFLPFTDRAGRRPTVVFDTWPVPCHSFAAGDASCAFGCVYDRIGELGLCTSFVGRYLPGQGGLLSYYLRRGLTGRILLRRDFTDASHRQAVESSADAAARHKSQAELPFTAPLAGTGGLSAELLAASQVVTRASVVDVQHFIAQRLDKKSSALLDADTFYPPLQAPTYTIRDVGDIEKHKLAHLLQRGGGGRQDDGGGRLGGRNSRKPGKVDPKKRSPRAGSSAPDGPGGLFGASNINHPAVKDTVGDALTDMIRRQHHPSLTRDEKSAIIECPVSHHRLFQFPTACTEWAFFDNVKRTEQKIPEDLGAARRIHLSMWAKCSEPTVNTTIGQIQWRFRFLRDLRGLVASKSAVLGVPLRHQLQFRDFDEDDCTLILSFGDIADVVQDIGKREKLEKTLWILQQEVQRELGATSFFMTHFASGHAVIKFPSRAARDCGLKRIATARFIRTAEYPPVAVFVPVVFTLLASPMDYRKLQKAVALQSAGLTGHVFVDVERNDVDEGLHRDATAIAAVYRGFRVRKLLRCMRELVDKERTQRRYLRQITFQELHHLKHIMSVEQQQLVILAEEEDRFNILDIEGQYAADHWRRRINFHIGAEAIGRSAIVKADQRLRMAKAEMGPRSVLWFSQTKEYDWILAAHRTWFKVVWSWYYILVEEFQEALTIKDNMRGSALQVYAASETASGNIRQQKLALLQPKNLVPPPCSFDFASSMHVVPIGVSNSRRKQLQELLTLSTRI